MGNLRSNVQQDENMIYIYVCMYIVFEYNKSALESTKPASSNRLIVKCPCPHEC